MSYADAYDPTRRSRDRRDRGSFPGSARCRGVLAEPGRGEGDDRPLLGGRARSQRTQSTWQSRGDPNYVRARGILDDIELFDAGFFKMSPREAEVTDPQQRVFLKPPGRRSSGPAMTPTRSTARSASTRACRTTHTSSRISIDRPDVLRNAGELTMLGNEKDYLATRVSYKLDLRGPSINVVTACSTSLVAVCQAVQALATHQCDMALAGGVSIRVPQRRGYLYQDGFITSPDGHCRAFDERAAGTVFSNGLGIVVLRRLDEALEDGDTIYAVIKGAAVNNDGSSRVSFTAPSVNGQADAVVMAQALAGIDPDTISYVEAHGTGTALGDPVEIAGLTQAFRAVSDKRGYCALGSVKTNIGHLDAAAGRHRSDQDRAGSASQDAAGDASTSRPRTRSSICRTLRSSSTRRWRRGQSSRVRGAPASARSGPGAPTPTSCSRKHPSVAPSDDARPEQLLLLSARSADGLERAAAMLGAHLASDVDVSLADVAYTLQVGRRRFDHRMAIVAKSREEAIGLLASSTPGRVADDPPGTQNPPLAFLFPGQGAQCANMGRRLYETEPVFRAEVDDCAEILRPHLDRDVRSLLYPRDEEAATAQMELAQTAMTQPAVFVTSYALAKLWQSWGLQADAMLGHSLGDFVAACLAGVFVREDALALVARRGRLMQELPSGSMLAVRGDAAAVESVLGSGVTIAGYNSPKVTVISGDHDAVASAAEQLERRGIAATALATSHAFHSPMMEPIVDHFVRVVAEVARQKPQIPFISSLTGDWITDDQAVDPAFWARQLREPVRFAEGAAKLLDDPRRVVLEVGPGQTLTKLLRQQPGCGPSRTVLPSLPRGDESDDVHSLLTALGQLWAAGTVADWGAVHGHPRRRRVPLPTYPFEPKRYWVDPAMTEDAPPEAAASVSEPEAVTGQPPAAVTPMPTSEETMSRSIEGQSTSAGRVADLIARLQTLFSELSGLDQAELDPAVSFVELGLDSLFLTQASTAIHKTFAVKVPFRDLLEDVSTLDAVAARIDSELPAEVVPAAPSAPPPSTPAPLPAPVIPAPARTAAHDGRTLTATPASDDLLERVVAQQMELMSLQLETLRGRAAPPAAAPVPEVAASHPAAPHPAAPHPAARHPAAPASAAPPTAPRRETKKSSENGTISFGPYRPPAREPGGRLTPSQDAALTAFMERYERRTAASKRFTAENRSHLADPRSAAGFRMMWKEIVYPIVTIAFFRIEALGPRRQRVRRPHQRLRDDSVRPQPAIHPRGDRGAAAAGIRDRSADNACGRRGADGVRDDRDGARCLLQHRLGGSDGRDPRRPHRQRP